MLKVDIKATKGRHTPGYSYKRPKIGLDAKEVDWDILNIYNKVETEVEVLHKT